MRSGVRIFHTTDALNAVNCFIKYVLKRGTVSVFIIWLPFHKLRRYRLVSCTMIDVPAAASNRGEMPSGNLLATSPYDTRASIYMRQASGTAGLWCQPVSFQQWRRNNLVSHAISLLFIVDTGIRRHVFFFIIYLFICLFIYLFIYLFICLFVCLFIYFILFYFIFLAFKPFLQ